MNWWKCWRWFCTKKNISKGWASAVEAVMPVMRNFWGGNANLFWGEMQLFWSELLRHWWHSAFNLQSLAFHDPLQPRIFHGIFLDFSFNSCPLVSWLDKSTALTNLLTFIFCDFLLFLWLDENQPLSDNPHRKSALWPIFSRIFWKENCSSDPNILQQFLLQGSISWVYKNTEKESSFPDFVNFGNSFLFFYSDLLWLARIKKHFDERSVGGGFAEGEGRGCIAGFSQKCNNGATNHCQACPRITRICLSSSFYLSFFC